MLYPAVVVEESREEKALRLFDRNEARHQSEHEEVLRCLHRAEDFSDAKQYYAALSDN